MARANDSHAPPVSTFTKFVTSMTDGARDTRMLLIAHEDVTCALGDERDAQDMSQGESCRERARQEPCARCRNEVAGKEEQVKTR